MQGFLSELSDLGVVLALICVPLATGAVFIPLGKAIAARIRHSDEQAPDHGSPRANYTAERIDRLERQVLCWIAALLMPSVVLGQSSVTDIHRIDRIIRTQVDSGFSGVVLVGRGDSVLLRQAYAPRTERLSADDAFWIASITKSFTAAAVLRLQEEGRVALTDSLVRFFPGAAADKRAITLYQLLAHTSGLGGEYTGGGISERSRAVRAILASELIHKPGDGYKYGDDDYELLAAIIEEVSGRPWEDFVQERLVRPAGLRHVGFACRTSTSARQPVGRAARAAKREEPISHVACDWGHKGANGMSASADDLMKWAQALRAGGLLGAAGNGALFRPQVFVRREPPFDVSYGFGLRLYTLNNDVVEVMFAGSGDDDHTAAVRLLRSGLRLSCFRTRDTTQAPRGARSLLANWPHANRRSRVQTVMSNEEL